MSPQDNPNIIGKVGKYSLEIEDSLKKKGPDDYRFDVSITLNNTLLATTSQDSARKQATQILDLIKAKLKKHSYLVSETSYLKNPGCPAFIAFQFESKQDRAEPASIARVHLEGACEEVESQLARRRERRHGKAITGLRETIEKVLRDNNMDPQIALEITGEIVDNFQIKPIPKQREL